MFIMLITFVMALPMLAVNFYTKYQARLRQLTLSSFRYKRIADYSGRPILIAFEYRHENSEMPLKVEADVNEIYHYGHDYFLKGHAANQKHSQIYKWSCIENASVHLRGRAVNSLEQLVQAAETSSWRVAA